MTYRNAYSPRAQHGAVLVVALIMLMLLSLVALSAVRSSTMDEKMVGNTRDRNKAFQAAEAAVRHCVNQVRANPVTIATVAPAAPTTTPVWAVAGVWSGANSVEVPFLANPPHTNLYANPRCIVENLNQTTPPTAALIKNFRITAWAVGGSSDTAVILQATYTEEP
jgi:type IV pilus assembly protein PilX